MSRHVIVGKGAVGTTLAHLLADRRSRRPGAQPVRRHLRRPHLARGRRRDRRRRPAAATRGADVLYNCASPAYHRWPTDWPPLWASLLDAASRTGAVLVTAGNLYGYATHGAVMTEDSPLDSTDSKGAVRAQMWRDAEARHRAGDLRVTEVRGPTTSARSRTPRRWPGRGSSIPLLAGKVVRPSSPSTSRTAGPTCPTSPARSPPPAAPPPRGDTAWHVPTAEPLTLRELGERFAAGGPAPRIRPIPAAVVRALGLVSPLLREVAAVSDHFTQPYVMDTAASSRVLGFVATPWDVAIAETLGRTAVGGRA